MDLDQLTQWEPTDLGARDLEVAAVELEHWRELGEHQREEANITFLTGLCRGEVCEMDV
jgi:hypothetical protein